MNKPIDIAKELGTFVNDPLGFAYFAFPWGEEGSEIEDFEGLEPWQWELLAYMRDQLVTGAALGVVLEQALQIATASGHGIGKSAIVAIIILWAISTMEDTKGVVTANTETQLKTKTWAELGKWYRMFIGKELFALTATAIFARDKEHERTWRIDMVPWSERNTEAFAGLHNKGLRVILIMDEASAIPDVIHEVAEGAMTDSGTQVIWMMFGNPTKATGRFREAFAGGRFAHRWKNFQIDSRMVSLTDKKQIEKWIKDYGEDSDFVRVRVKGVFPRVGSMQFIGEELVNQAAQREVAAHIHDPLVIGVDVARFGDDESVVVFRKGRDGRTIPPIRLRGQRGSVDTMTLAGKVAEVYLAYRADAVFVDGTGVGGGVVDRLRQLQVPCWDIQFGAKADLTDAPGTDAAGTRYANKRAEIWGSLRDWLSIGGIPQEKDLKEQLVGPQYGFNRNNEIQLEAKDDMKKRGLASPDWADAIALTFAYPVIPNSMAGGLHPGQPVMTDYDPIRQFEREMANAN